MEASSVWVIVFGSVEDERLRRAAAFVAALPRLLEGEVLECDAAYSASGRVLLALARFGPDGPSADAVQRLEFWTHHENGRAVALPGSTPEERREDVLLRLFERTARRIAPSRLATALAGLVSGGGAVEDVVVPRLWSLMLDISDDTSGAVFDGRSGTLFVPMPLPLPVGDELAIKILSDAGVRTCEARVEAWREAASAGPGTAPGLVLGLRKPSGDLLATVATRLGASRRRSPRYAVNLPARVQLEGESPLVRVEYRSRSHFAAEYVQNLSYGGAFVRTERPPPVGSRVRLELVLPNGQELVVPATVAHVRLGGMGLEFEFDAGLEAALAAAIADIARLQRRALVVDDSLLARRLLADALAARGFAVTEAPDGASALRALIDRLFAIDVVVADLVMPGMTGEELLKEIRTRGGPSPAVVLASGRMDEETRLRLERLGVDRVLDKSLGPEEVAEEAAKAAEAADAAKCFER